MRFGGIRARSAAAFTWWLRELGGMLPAGLRLAVNSARSNLVLTFSETHVRLDERQGQAWQTLGHAERRPDAGNAQGDMAEPIRRAIGLAKRRSSPVAVRMERKYFLRHLIELPIATANNLRELFSFEMDRFTPFKAAEVYFDFRIVGANPERQRITIDLAVITRHSAEQALSFARAIGLEPAYLGMATGPDDGAAAFNFLPAKPAAPRQNLLRILVGVLAISFVALLGAALYLPILQKQNTFAAMEASLAELRVEAKAADSLKTLLEQTLERSQAVVEKRRQWPTATELLEEISDVLPDDTWISQLRLNGDKIELAGYSARPSALIGLLEESPFLTGVQFNGALKPDPRQGRDAFKLSASIVPGGQSR